MDEVDQESGREGRPAKRTAGVGGPDAKRSKKHERERTDEERL